MGPIFPGEWDHWEVVHRGDDNSQLPYSGGGLGKEFEDQWNSPAKARNITQTGFQVGNTETLYDINFRIPNMLHGIKAWDFKIQNCTSWLNFSSLFNPQIYSKTALSEFDIRPPYATKSF